MRLTKPKLAAINATSLAGLTGLAAYLPEKYQWVVPFVVQLANWYLQAQALSSPRPHLVSRRTLDALWEIAHDREVDLPTLALGNFGKAVSALTPREAAELMQELKKHYTIAIVTHNMQQAARASDYTAMMMLSKEGERSGTVIEFDETDRIFTRPKDKRTEDYVTGRFG